MYRSAIALAAGIALAGATRPAEAQKNSPPTGVAAVQSAAGVTVSWTPVKGAIYRITRAPDPKSAGVDLTQPIKGTSFDDQTVTLGATYYYQVIAVYSNGATGAAAPVGVTLPPPVVNLKTGGLAGVQAMKAGGRFGPPPAPPPAPTPLPPPPAVTVTGTTTASAAVSWTLVSGATSYTVTRSGPSASSSPGSYPGLPGPNWTDLGPNNVGFWLGGVYQYQVTALFADGRSVSGSASWTRPSPVCAPPPANQPMLAVLNPVTTSQIVAQGPYPGGGVFTWTANPNHLIAMLVDRSVQGSNAWMSVGTSCVGNPSATAVFTGRSTDFGAVFIDNTGGIVPNTTYLYRFTGLAANGDAGSGTMTWTAPSSGILRWIAITSGATSTTFQWRYEPPLGTAPAAPYRQYALTYGNGLTQNQNYGVSCATYVGCSMTVSNPPKGSQPVRITANWIYNKQTNQGNIPTTMGTVFADTVIVVP